MCLFRYEQAHRADEIVSHLRARGAAVVSVLVGTEQTGPSSSGFLQLTCETRLQKWLAGFKYRHCLSGMVEPILWIGAADLFSIAYGCDYSAVVYDVDAEQLTNLDDGLAWYDYETLLAEAQVVVPRDQHVRASVARHLQELPRSTSVLAPAGCNVDGILARLGDSGAVCVA